MKSDRHLISLNIHSRHTQTVLFILFVALALRLIYALSLDPMAPYTTPSGDTVWYLAYGLGLYSGKEFDVIRDFAVTASRIPTAPLYLIFLGFMQKVMSLDAAVIAIRTLQSLMGTVTCLFVYGIARMLSEDRRVGLVAAGVLAVSPVFVQEPGNILTETMYIFFISGALWLTLRWLAANEHRPRIAYPALMYGLATLTRAVAILFPVGIAIHFVLALGWRNARRAVASLLVVYVLVLSTWTIYNLAAWGRFVFVQDGYTAIFYAGAGGWEDPFLLDASVQHTVNIPESSSPDESDYLNAAAATISSDPLGYVSHRISERANAYLQPHGTVAYGGKSLKAAVSEWWQGDRSIGGLLALTQGDYFWQKLVIYIFHYTGLILGFAGMWLYRRRWRLTLPLMGFVLYTTLLHLVVLATPRYIFPTEIVFWAFAAATLVALWDRIRNARKSASGDIPSGTAQQA